ncbi:MAG: hypothetical protein J2P57_18420 [Acidimicrobiaceae bacterium]|nr:hypothetical protein [Acidimicrobiaceae bacterium]
MAATTHATGRLGESARALRASKEALEALASTLHQRTTAMAWKGGAADKFRADVAKEANLTAHATELMTKLANRMEAIEEQARELEARLTNAEHQLDNQIHTEIKRLEKFEATHPGAAVNQAAITWLQGAVKTSGILANDVKGLERL